jgi:hypothetical protein
MANASMKNVLASLPFYRKKSIMILDLSTTIAYSICSPMMSLKFAPRDDEKSKGKWEDENIFYFPNYQSVYDFASRLKSIVATKEATDTNFANPAKHKGIFVRKSIADNGTVYITFTFYTGSKEDGKKINTSLMVDEANAILSVLASFISNYATIAQMALLRNDTWFNLYGKSKSDDGGGQTDKPSYQKPSGSTGSTGSTQKSNQTQKPSAPDENLINDIEKEFGFGGSDPGLGEDVPF